MKKVEDTIRQNVDEMDIVLRIGGEEFAFLCRNTLRENRKKIVERIIYRKEQLRIDYKGQHVPVTISAGMSQYKDESIDELFGKTVQALL